MIWLFLTIHLKILIFRRYNIKNYVIVIDEALEILLELEDEIGTCCGITMDPEEVELLMYRLKEILIKLKDVKE